VPAPVNARSRRRPLRIAACLSLSGRHSYFGAQAAAGLQTWRRLTPNVELLIEDDRSDAGRLRAQLPWLASRCDLLLGPYSTGLARAAAAVAADTGRLLWNHGGAGDDVQTLSPGHVVSVLTPANRYAAPFVGRLAADASSAPLLIVQGKGRFGRQVADGAATLAEASGMKTVRLQAADASALEARGEGWHLFCAGSFEEDVETVRRALRLTVPPQSLCAVAAGVRRFGPAVPEGHGVYGVAQWFPGSSGTPDLGPPEDDFLDAYSRLAGGAADYPAAQAAAAAALAARCAELAGSVEPAALWSAATALEVTTLFGRFRIDPTTGAQAGHETVLVRWGSEGPGLVPSARPVGGFGRGATPGYARDCRRLRSLLEQMDWPSIS
jgi:ABC-type branched-subunit amino acid transport system substrate-binding protein